MTVLEAMLLFALVAIPLTIMPGLDSALVLRTALVSGRRHAYATALGINAGVLVWGVAAAVEGVVAEIVPRTASEDGALEQEGDAEFTLAGDVYFDSGSAVLLPRATADLAAVAAQVGGKGGGKADMAMAGGTDPAGLDKALASVRDWTGSRL